MMVGRQFIAPGLSQRFTPGEDGRDYRGLGRSRSLRSWIRYFGSASFLSWSRLSA